VCCSSGVTILGGFNLAAMLSRERRNTFSYMNEQFSEFSTLFQNPGIERWYKIVGGGGLHWVSPQLQTRPTLRVWIGTTTHRI
jgi:aryl carrier-like protein